MTDSPGGRGRPRKRHSPPVGRVALQRAGPHPRVRPLGTVRGSQAIFTTEIPYVTIFGAHVTFLGVGIARAGARPGRERLGVHERIPGRAK